MARTRVPALSAAAEPLLVVVAVLSALLCVHVSSVRAMYVPGVPVHDFTDGEVFTVLANSVTSDRTLLPLEYRSVPTKVPDTLDYVPLNFGQILHGDRIMSTVFVGKFKHGDEPTPAHERDLSHADITRLAYLINNDYQYTFIVDNMPCVSEDDASVARPPEHIPIGEVVSNEYYVLQNFAFVIKYRPSPTDATKFRVVGCEMAQPAAADFLAIQANTTIAKLSVTYKFEYEVADPSVDWENRWDSLLALPDEIIETHLTTTIVAAVLVLLLGVMVLITLCRTVRDIRRYNESSARRASGDEPASGDFDEMGWKFVHRDVLRTPRRPALLSIFVGVGVQLAVTSALCAVLELFGVLSPASRGSLGTAWIWTFSFTGLVSGFVSCRLYRMFRESAPWKVAVTSALIFSAPVLGIGFLLNFVLIGSDSSMAIPVGTIFAFIALWGVYLVGNGVGRIVAARHRTYTFPVQVNELPRDVPAPPWYVRTWLAPLIGGVLPFAVMFTVLSESVRSAWLDLPYYLGGYTFIVSLLVVFTSAAAAIIQAYYFLCWENYHWWWRSFITPGFAAVYAFIFMVGFLINLAPTTGAGVFMYLVYSMIVCFALFCMLGSVGFLATLLYVWKMYGSVKFD